MLGELADKTDRFFGALGDDYFTPFA